MNSRRIIVPLLLCCMFSSASAEQAERIQVLIVDGYGNHDWSRTTGYIQQILDASDLFDITVSTYPLESGADAEALWNPDFAGHDVVIQTVNDLGGRGPRWSRSVEKALEDFVSQGGGLYVFHSGNNAFAEWPEYNRMIGLGWRHKDFGPAITISDNGALVRLPAGEGERTGHGKRTNALITRVGEHPIEENIPRQWRAADIEIYQYARGPAENLTVLSYARDPSTGLNFPVEWVVNYDSGRVFNATFGHLWTGQADPTGLQCAGFQTIFLRALQWLAGRDVDASLPGDFPGIDVPSLRLGRSVEASGVSSHHEIKIVAGQT